MPVPFTAAQIKAWFETGDVPTQQQFADFIDTLFHQIQQANDNADAALALAALATKCYGLITFNSTGSPTGPGSASLTVNRVQGCAVAATFTGFNTSAMTGVATVTITPTTNFADTNITVLVNSDVGVGQPTATTRNVGSIVLVIPLTFVYAAGAQTKKFQFLAMP